MMLIGMLQQLLTAKEFRSGLAKQTSERLTRKSLSVPVQNLDLGSGAINSIGFAVALVRIVLVAVIVRPGIISVV